MELAPHPHPANGTSASVAPVADFKAIASYLHAEPCQQLTALNFRLEALRRSLDPAAPLSTAAARRSVSEVIELGMQCTYQIRSLINWLRYDGSDAGRLIECLSAAVSMNGNSGVPVPVSIAGSSDHLTDDDRCWLVQTAGISGIELRGLGILIKSVELCLESDQIGVRLHLDPGESTDGGQKIAHACECLAAHQNRSGQLTTHFEVGRHYVEVSYKRSAHSA